VSDAPAGQNIYRKQEMGVENCPRENLFQGTNLLSDACQPQAGNNIGLQKSSQIVTRQTPTN